MKNNNKSAFTLIELLVVIAIVIVLSAVAVPAGISVLRSSSLAVSATNIRQLAAGGAAYLGENNYRFWPYLQKSQDGDVWWFGLEPSSSKGKPGISVSTKPGFSYRLEYSESMAGPWMPMGNGVSGTGGAITFVDETPSLPAQRFYRIAVTIP